MADRRFKEVKGLYVPDSFVNGKMIPQFPHEAKVQVRTTKTHTTSLSLAVDGFGMIMISLDDVKEIIRLAEKGEK